jgi:hypothetical protein
MKPRHLSCLVLLSCAAVNAQDGGTIVTSAPTLESGLNTLDARLTQLLDEAKQQTDKLQKTLDKMGDPSSVNLASLQLIKDDILSSANALKTQQEKRQAIGALTGSEVFDEDANGLLTAIGPTFTRKDGTVVDRDPEKYKLEAGLMMEIKEYKEIREKAVEQQKILGDELANVMQDLQDAQDFATIQKLNSMIAALNGQIEDWNQKVMTARADVDMAEKEYQSTARVVNKGRLEAVEDAKGGGLTPAEIQAKISELNLGKSSTGRMPWGRKGSQSVGEEAPAP